MKNEIEGIQATVAMCQIMIEVEGVPFLLQVQMMEEGGLVTVLKMGLGDENPDYIGDFVLQDIIKKVLKMCVRDIAARSIELVRNEQAEIKWEVM